MSRSDIDSTELPALTLRTHCVLIPRDPDYVYAYWDYTQQDIDQLRRQLKEKEGAPEFILRVYDITGIEFNGSNARHAWDLNIGFSTKNWYIHVEQDNADYCVEIGLRYGDNYFVPLTRSNTARTPPKSASSRNDLIWQDIKSHKESKPYLKEDINERYQNLAGRQSKKKSHPAAKSSPRIYRLTPHDIRDYYRKIFTGASPSRRCKALSMENIIKSRSGGISWQKVRPLMTSWCSIERVHPGASQDRLIEHSASEGSSNSQTGASEGRLNSRKFFFEISTELLVYGRTEPDAAVYLNEKEIKLNPDGTFSLRYSLVDGEIPLKFIAQSSDGVEQRHIHTGVERKKTIGFPKMLKDPNG